jgi:uncharacterized Rmd1/YagE family protein
MNDTLLVTRERRVTVRALLLGDRIETAGLERNDVLSTVPLAFRAGQHGVVALFRYGVVVSVGMTPLEEEEVIGRLKGRIVGAINPREEESFQIEIAPDKDDQLTPTGIIAVKALTTEHTLLIADALATSVVLAHDEKRVAEVFDVIQPMRADWRNAAARPAAAAPSSNTSATHCWCSTAFPVWSRWRKSPTCFGSGPIWSASTLVSKTNTN